MVDKTKKPRINNLVAKHARKYNKSNVMTDRKKAEKRGYKKHSKDERTQEGVAVESLDNAKSEKDSAQIKLRHANQKVRLAKRQEREKQMKEEFTPHDMYHPETGEKKHAKTKATHLVLKAKGWTHTPKEEIDSASKKPEKFTKTDGTVGTRMVPAHKKIVDESVEEVEQDVEMLDEALKSVDQKRYNLRLRGRDVKLVLVPKSTTEYSYQWKRKDGSKGYAELDTRFDGADMETVKRVIRREIFLQDKNDGTSNYMNKVRATKSVKEVKQVDENMYGYEGKKKIKIYHSDSKVHKSAVGTFDGEHNKAEHDKKTNTTTLHMKKPITKDQAAKLGRFNSNWRTRSNYTESVDHLKEAHFIVQFRDEKGKADSSSKRFKNASAAKKHAAMANKITKVGSYSVHKVQGRMESVEQVDEAISAVVVKKMQDMVGGADKMPRGAEFRKLKAKAQAAVKAERAGKKAAPKAQTTTKTAKGKVHKGSADAADRNLIMQLRKAQDIDGKMDIQVSPAGRTIRLSKKQIDTFLAKHDSLAKPVDKRKFKILLTKALRSKAK